MMNDRELLELAAKAAGIKARWFKVNKYKTEILRTGPASMHSGTIYVFGTHHTKPWNPLTDDGDAFRLAVMLNLTIGVESDAQAVWWAGDSLEDVNEPLGSDPFAAMRRAIVRAAAAIGEAMP